MRLFTGKGDDGTTDLLGERVAKDDPRIDLIGELDEATSSIGMARALARSDRTRGHLLDAQRDLYQIMAELAFTDEIRPDAWVLPASKVAELEARTDAISAEVQLPPHFIVPGDTVPGAACDVARTVVRRAERIAVALAREGVVTNPEIIRYLNRLSSLLFMLARWEEHELGRESATPAKPAKQG